MEDKGVGGGKSFIAGEKYCLGIQLNQTLCLSAGQQNTESYTFAYAKHLMKQCFRNILQVLAKTCWVSCQLCKELLENRAWALQLT